MATLGLTGIQGLNQERFRVVIQPEASPAGVHGNAVDPKHGKTGEVAEPYPWIEFLGPHGPYGPAEDQMLSESVEQRTLPAGEIQQDPSGDYAPYYSHAGPNIPGNVIDAEVGPNHLPDGVSAYLRKSALAHGVRTNSGEKGRASSNPENDPWQRFWNPVQGEDELPPITPQVSTAAGGFGTHDRTSNAYHKANAFQLNTSHRMRRYSTNVVPGNWMWMNPGGRPLHKTLAGPAQIPVGEGPFSGQDTGYGFGVEGAVLMDPATSYTTPPLPYTTPPAQQSVNESAPQIDLW